MVARVGVVGAGADVVILLRLCCQFFISSVARIVECSSVIVLIIVVLIILITVVVVLILAPLTCLHHVQGVVWYRVFLTSVSGAGVGLVLIWSRLPTQYLSWFHRSSSPRSSSLGAADLPPGERLRGSAINIVNHHQLFYYLRSMIATADDTAVSGGCIPMFQCQWLGVTLSLKF